MIGVTMGNYKLDIRPKVGIVILNYMTYELTIKLLSDLSKLSYSNFFVIVVDNNSPNSSFLEIEKFISSRTFTFNVTLLESNVNGGYSSGNNIGSRKAHELGAEFTLIMNNDIEIIDCEVINKLIDYLLIKPETKMIYPAIQRPNGIIELPSFNSRPSLFSCILANIFYPFVVLYNISTRKRKKHTEKNVYSASGCFFLIQSEVFHEIDYLDENIFLYGEEWILGEKLFKRQCKVIYYPETSVLHNHSMTSKNIYKMKEIAKMQSDNLVYYFKNYRDKKNGIRIWIFKFSEIIKVELYFRIIVKIKKIIKSKK